MKHSPHACSCCCRLRLGLTAVKAILSNPGPDGVCLAVNQSCHRTLDAVLAAFDANSSASHSIIGKHIRDHPAWKTLAGAFWEDVVTESLLGPKFEACLLSVQRIGASSPEWLTACQSLAFGSRSLRKGQLEEEMVRAVASLDAEILLSSANPETTVPQQLQALNAAIEGLAKLAALEDAIGHARTDLLQVRRNIEAQVSRARQVVLCSTAVRALSAAAADVSMETLTAASDSLQDPRLMASVMTENARATVQAAIGKFMDAFLKLQFDCPAHFQLGYHLVDVQELADILAARPDDSAYYAKALFHSQRVALQTWEATVAVERAVPATTGGISLAAQKLPAARLARCLAEWANLSEAAAPDQPAYLRHVSVTPDDAMPAACEAGVFVRGTALLNLYYSNILVDALDRLQSATLALKNVANGANDSASWKNMLASNASFWDVTEAAQVLMVNAPNYAKPVADLKQARAGCNSRPEFQDCLHANQHVQTSQPHAAHSSVTCCCPNVDQRLSPCTRAFARRVRRT